MKEGANDRLRERERERRNDATLLIIAICALVFLDDLISGKHDVNLITAYTQPI